MFCGYVSWHQDYENLVIGKKKASDFLLNKAVDITENAM